MEEQSAGWTPAQVVGLLRRVSLFEGLPRDDLERVASIVTAEQVDEGRVLFEEGDPGDAFYIVFRGAVEIIKRKPSGDEEKLAVRRDGSAFGEMALLNDAPRSATARATADTSLIAVSRDAFMDLLGGDSLAVRLMRSLSKALRALDVRFAAQQRAAGTGASAVREVSRLMQRGLLARNAPRVEGYDVAASTSVQDDGRGSAVWESFELRDGRTVLAAVDVRGDGLPPAHYLSLTGALLREIAREVEETGELLPRVNDALVRQIVEGLDQCVECGLATLGDGGAVEWVGAGQAPGALVRADGSFEPLPSTGPALGILEGFEYAIREVTLEPGDGLLVLSDAPKAVFHGAGDVVARMGDADAGEVVSTLHEALERAREQLPDGHDTTVLFVRRK